MKGNDKMDFEVIEKLPDELKRRLIDHIVDLPSDVALSIKMSINNPRMDPSLWRSRDRVLSPYATIGKSLNSKCDITMTDNPASSYYQSGYSSVMRKIDNLHSSYPLISSKSSALRQIMNMPCYDLESLLCIEKSISELFTNSEHLNRDLLSESLAQFINDEIITYKLEALAVNQDLLFSTSGFDMFGTYPFLNIHRAITYAVRDMGDSYPTIQNIAILIYVYFKQLGITDDIVNKYNLFKRFKLFIMPYNKDTDTIHEILMNFFNDNINVVSAMSRLTNDNDFVGVLYNNYDEPISINTSDSVLQSNGFVFLDNGTNMSELMTTEIAMMIKKTDESSIASCMRRLGYRTVTENCISFNISDNDFGHIINGCKIPVGNATDIFTHVTKNIASYDNDWYILFTNYMERNSIFGINITNTKEERKILEIKKDKSFSYKYISML